MRFKDLREDMASLEGEGELQRISREVNWNLEVGAIIRRAMDLKAPASRPQCRPLGCQPPWMHDPLDR